MPKDLLLPNGNRIQVNAEPVQIFQPEQYVFDWEKITTLEDVLMILKMLSPNITIFKPEEKDAEWFKQIEHKLIRLA